MFGICGFVTAQNATEAKDAKMIRNAAKQQATKQAAQPSFTTAAESNAKSTTDDQAVAATSADKAPTDAQAQSPEAAKKMEQSKVREAKYGAVEVNAAGVVVDDAAKKQQVKKAEAAKAAATKKTADN